MNQEVIITMVQTKEQGLQIAHALVGEGLAACVNVVDKATSVYRWQGKICEEDEFLLVIKSNSINFAKIKTRILELHSYDLPEIIMFNIDAGHEAYLDWIDKNS